MLNRRNGNATLEVRYHTERPGIVIDSLRTSLGASKVNVGLCSSWLRNTQPFIQKPLGFIRNWENWKWENWKMVKFSNWPPLIASRRIITIRNIFIMPVGHISRPLPRQSLPHRNVSGGTKHFRKRREKTSQIVSSQTLNVFFFLSFLQKLNRLINPQLSEWNEDSIWGRTIINYVIIWMPSHPAYRAPRRKKPKKKLIVWWHDRQSSGDGYRIFRNAQFRVGSLSLSRPRVHFQTVNTLRN